MKLGKLSTLRMGVFALIIIGLSACDGKKKKTSSASSGAQSGQQELKIETPEEIQARVEAERKAYEENEARKASELSQFSQISISSEGLKTGDVLRGTVLLKKSFSNPFDMQSVYVDAFISDGKGSGENVRLLFAGDEDGKSKWLLSHILRNSGDYKCVFGLRHGKAFENSSEYTFKVENSDAKGRAIYPIKGNPFFLKSDRGEFVRLVGANIPSGLSLDEKKALLKTLKDAGANVARICVSLTSNLIVAEDSFFGKAGWINISAVNDIEEFVKEAESQGVYVIVNFASAKDFEQSSFEKTYFAKSGLAATPEEFFKNIKASEFFNSTAEYLVLRLSSYQNVAAWQVISEADKTLDANLNDRIYWAQRTASFLKESDKLLRMPLVSLGGSNDFDFIWSGESSALVCFELSDRKDFANSIASHADYFAPRYKKGVSVLSARLSKDSDPSGVYQRNATWASMFSPSPIITLIDFEKSPSERDLALIKSLSEFEAKFVDGGKYKARQLPTVNQIVSQKSSDNKIFIDIPFGFTNSNMESSSDIAKFSVDKNGTIVNNTLSPVWRSGSMITFEFEELPKGAFLQFTIYGALKADGDICNVKAMDYEGEQVLNEHFDPASVKNFAKDALDREYAVFNKNIKIPLNEEKAKLEFHVSSTQYKSFVTVGDFQLTGIGSKMGIYSIDVRALVDEEKDKSILWFRRELYSNHSYEKNKLHGRDISPARSFEYSIPVGSAKAKYKLTWWNSVENKELSSGELSSGADKVLKFRTPAISNDVVLVVTPVK